MELSSFSVWPVLGFALCGRTTWPGWGWVTFLVAHTCLLSRAACPPVLVCPLALRARRLCQPIHCIAYVPGTCARLVNLSTVSASSTIRSLRLID